MKSFIRRIKFFMKKRNLLPRHIFICNGKGNIIRFIRVVLFCVRRGSPAGQMFFRVNGPDAFRQNDRFEVFASHIRIAIIVTSPFYSCGTKFFATIGNHCFFAEIRDADEAFSILCVEKAVDRSVFGVNFGYHDIFRRQIHKYFQIETACQFNGFDRRINVKLKDRKILVASIDYFYISRHLDLCQFFAGT